MADINTPDSKMTLEQFNAAAANNWRNRKAKSGDAKYLFLRINPATKKPEFRKFVVKQICEKSHITSAHVTRGPIDEGETLLATSDFNKTLCWSEQDALLAAAESHRKKAEEHQKMCDLLTAEAENYG